MKLEVQSYKNVAWGPITAVLGTIGIFFLGQLLAGLSIYAVLLLLGWDNNRIESWIGAGGSAQFTLVITAGLFSLLILFYFLRRRKASLAQLGLVKPRPIDFLYSLAGFGTYFISYIFVVGIISQFFRSLNLDQKQDIGFSVDTTGGALVLVFIALVIFPPLVEEIITRGFLFSGLRKGLNFLPAAFLTSALFGLAHLGGGEGGEAIWIAAIDTFILGMVLAYLRERTGSLWASIGLHATKNLIAFLALFVFKIV